MYVKDVFVNIQIRNVVFDLWLQQLWKKVWIKMWIWAKTKKYIQKLKNLTLNPNATSKSYIKITISKHYIKKLKLKYKLFSLGEVGIAQEIILSAVLSSYIITKYYYKSSLQLIGLHVWKWNNSTRENTF